MSETAKRLGLDAYQVEDVRHLKSILVGAMETARWLEHRIPADAPSGVRAEAGGITYGLGIAVDNARNLIDRLDGIL